MVLGNAEKVSILVSALRERYRALDAIRDRVQGVSVWSLGLLLGAAGWILQSGKAFADDQTAISCIGVLAAWIVLRFVFLADLRTGFRGQQKVAAGLEDLLGFYAPGRFGPESEALFPGVWRQAGSKGGGGRFFQSTLMMVDVGLVMFLVSALSRNDWVRAWASWALERAGL
jgi:hypothetical protein